MPEIVALVASDVVVPPNGDPFGPELMPDGYDAMFTVVEVLIGVGFVVAPAPAPAGPVRRLRRSGVNANAGPPGPDLDATPDDSTQLEDPAPRAGASPSNGRGWRPAAFSILSILVILGLAAFVASRFGPSGSVPEPVAALDLRAVTAATSGACADLAPVSAGPGRACGWSGTTTVELGELLGTATASQWSAADSSVVLTLDSAGQADLAAVTRQLVGKELAVLLDGRVVAAVQVVEPLTSADLVLALASPEEAEDVTATLSGPGGG